MTKDYIYTNGNSTTLGYTHNVKTIPNELTHTTMSKSHWDNFTTSKSNDFITEWTTTTTLPNNDNVTYLHNGNKQINMDYHIATDYFPFGTPLK